MTTTLLESLRCQNTHFRAQFRETSYKDLVFARCEILSLVGAQNESLSIIIIYCIKIHISDRNNFARFTSEQKKPSKRLELGETSYKDLVFVRSDLIRIVGAPNESLRLVIIYYMFKYSFRIKTTLLESLRSQKSILKAIFWQN